MFSLSLVMVSVCQWSDIINSSPRVWSIVCIIHSLNTNQWSKNVYLAFNIFLQYCIRCCFGGSWYILKKVSKWIWKVFIGVLHHSLIKFSIPTVMWCNLVGKPAAGTEPRYTEQPILVFNTSSALVYLDMGG